MLRPREKLLKEGAASLSNAELLALLLGKGVAGKPVEALAADLDGFLQSCCRMPTPEQLVGFRGMGPAKACQILAGLELSCRFLLSSGGEEPITSPVQLLPRLSFLKLASQEQVVCVTLDAGNRVLRIHPLTLGLLNSAPIAPREAFRNAILDAALSVIFVHNHPSGSLDPSVEDIQVTRQLVHCGELLEISVLDHLIVSSAGWTSIRTLRGDLFRTSALHSDPGS